MKFLPLVLNALLSKLAVSIVLLPSWVASSIKISEPVLEAAMQTPAVTHPPLWFERWVCMFWITRTSYVSSYLELFITLVEINLCFKIVDSVLSLSDCILLHGLFHLLFLIVGCGINSFTSHPAEIIDFCFCISFHVGFMYINGFLLFLKFQIGIFNMLDAWFSRFSLLQNAFFPQENVFGILAWLLKYFWK